MLNEKLLKEVIEEKIKDEMIYRKLNSSNFPLEGPFEAYYFKALRDFFENSISHMIMNNHQDIPKILIKQKEF